MGYHPRIESRDRASFLTTRSRNSELWFVNNRRLEEAILGYAAKYTKRYSVKLYALAIEGNHVQGPALFPEGNRADFMRDFNSNIARAVPRYVPSYPGGRFWGRRYSNEFFPELTDIEDKFFYTVLQAVQDGHAETISGYPGYNCFHDAIWAIARKFKVVRWAEYNAAKRHNPRVSIKDFTDIVSLEYERLPGYEHLSQKEYAKLMMEKLEEKRAALVKERLSQGLSYTGWDALIKVKPGSIPHHTKTSTIHDHRPRALSTSKERRDACLAWYFDIYWRYKDASRRYRAGDLNAQFPEGTYRPYCALHPPEKKP